MFGIKSCLLSLIALQFTTATPVSLLYNTLPSTPNIINLQVTARASTYTVQANDTIAVIAAKYGVGICDIARLNILADPKIIYPGEVLRIPARALFPEDTSCMSVNNTATTNTCIYGGPHVYTILPGDTIQKIANERYNITSDSIITTEAQTGYIAALNPGSYDVLETGQTVKIPICPNTVCTMTSYDISYGTLQDFATQYNVTVGQIMSFNPGYNHSELAPSLMVPYDCALLE